MPENDQDKKKRIETIAAQAGHEIDAQTGAVMSPIHMSTTFERDADGEYSRGYVYSRSGNPTRSSLEDVLARLEGGECAAAFSSGSAASAAVIQALSAGDHIIAPNDCYHGTTALLRNVFARWGLNTTFTDVTDLECVKKAMRPNTRLVWVETPSNPMLKLTDIRQTAQIAHDVGAICVCDNTWATPVNQQPLSLGADLVVHATTKYLGGHGDVMGGAVVSARDDDFFQRVKEVQRTYGAVPSPFDCWLVNRGIRTLHLRMKTHGDNAMEIARFLSDHTMIEAVHYPGLEGHPGHSIASKQMSGFGGMMSLQVRGGRDEATKVAAKAKLFMRATSLGGTESLIEHRASIEGTDTKTPQNLLRLSIGIENVVDLIEDLEQALG